MFSGLRAMLGLDEVVAVNVGAAPTPVEVLEFFHAIGLPLGELWGMSRDLRRGRRATRPSEIKIGTVGPPAPGVEIKLADGRRGAGPRRLRDDAATATCPSKTAETFDDDGWLRTGDIGEIDEDGYLKIVDRKKELIINAAGKNMSPANIEATLKTALAADRPGVRDRRRAPLQHRADRARPRLRARRGPSSRGSRTRSLEAARRRRARARGGPGGRRRGQRSSSRASSRSRSSRSCAGDWLPGGDELTPTMKLKRKPIAEKYAAEIEALYAR